MALRPKPACQPYILCSAGGGEKRTGTWSQGAATLMRHCSHVHTLGRQPLTARAGGRHSAVLLHRGLGDTGWWCPRPSTDPHLLPRAQDPPYKSPICFPGLRDLPTWPFPTAWPQGTPGKEGAERQVCRRGKGRHDVGRDARSRGTGSHWSRVFSRDVGDRERGEKSWDGLDGRRGQGLISNPPGPC